MITVHSSRLKPENRVHTTSDKYPSARSETYMPPTGGLLTNAPLANSPSQTALILENFWPTATGIEPRGGTKLRCTIGGSVEALFQYRVNKTYFAADENNIYEFSDQTPSVTALSPVVTDQSNADYSTLEKQTDAGSFLTVVNGEDYAQIYDGTSWQQVTEVSSPFSITGISTDRLTYAWSHRNRTFFIEKNSMDAWYLGINSVAGEATKLPLAGVFNKGGSLLFGATWSSDSGDGMDDRCVFATDQGEFAVFSGDPVDGWSMTGVYDIGEPLGKNSTMQVGGDLIIATKSGLIPISSAVSKDTSQLKLDSLSRNIEPDWRKEVILSGNIDGWQLVKWDSRNMAVVSPPNRNADQNFCWAVNLETGAWTTFTGWQINNTCVLDDSLHYGDSNGNIFLCDVGGFDNGNAFECRACFSFDHLNSPGALKTVHTLKGIWRYKSAFAVSHSVAINYQPAFGVAPSVPVVTGGGEGEWGVSDWDNDFWANSNSSYQIQESLESISAQGEVLAPQIQITSAQNTKLNCELISIDMLFTVGGIVV